MPGTNVSTRSVTVTSHAHFGVGENRAIPALPLLEATIAAFSTARMPAIVLESRCILSAASVKAATA